MTNHTFPTIYFLLIFPISPYRLSSLLFLLSPSTKYSPLSRDTPGILWPKFEDQQVGIRLACVGSIKDDILNMEELALWLIDYLRENYKGILAERYQITEEGTSVEVLEAIARARGCLKKQEELDYAKASLILFDDFRSGKMGRITLEWAPL